MSELGLPPSPNDLQDRFRRVVLADRLLQAGSTVLVGVSGRADSVALAHLLHGLGDELSLNLLLVHIPDHSPSSAATKEEFVATLAQDLHASTVRVDTIRDAAGTPEARARYRFASLERARVRARATCIATGETSDDIAEQFLLNLVHENDAVGEIPLATNGTIIRPLLSFTHAEVLAFLADRQIPFQTNPDALALTSQARRVRLLILPILRRHVTKDALTNLAAAAQVVVDDHHFVQEVARAARTEVGWTESAGRVMLDHARWSALPAALRRRVLTDALGVSLPTTVVARAELLSLDARCRHLLIGETLAVGALKIGRSNGMLTVVHA